VDYKIAQIIKSKRKSVSIKVLDDGSLEIKCPKQISKRDIYAIIEKHSSWIDNKLETLKNRKVVVHKYVEGEEFTVLGRKVILKFNSAYKIPAIVDNQLFVANNPNTDLKKVIELWYRKIALELLNRRALIYSKLLGVSYSKLKLSSAKTRWGSCSSKGNINLNWRLIMAPLEIFDYVVVHELAHLIEPNHSQRFWYHVHRILPNYKNCRKWLKENGYSLNL